VSSSEGKEKASRATIEGVLDELRSVVAEAEEFLTTTDEEGHGPAERIRARVEDSLSKVKTRLDDAELGERAKAGGKAVDDYVRENPWIAAVVAVGIGFLIGRSGRRD